MDTQKYVDYLKHTIKPFAKTVSGNREINCRCFYCSDSKDQRKGHFYISIPQEGSDEPSCFYCQKCHTFGVVTHTKLIEWNIYDASMAIELSAYNKQVLSLSKNVKYKDSVVYNLKYNRITQDKLTKFKLNYINKRIGTNLTYDNCIQEKILLNLNDIIQTNHLDLTRHPNIVEQLDSCFVGFISHDNAFVNMRNLDIKPVHKSIDMRYVNYNIFGKYDNTNRFYTIPTQINLWDPRPVQLHIAEGPFDILSIYHNMRKTLDHCIYASIAGSGYVGLIRFFISVMKLINIELHIYADNDVERYKIVNIAKLIYPFHIKMYLHRNNFPGEKDFGVDVLRINESIELI